MTKSADPELLDLLPHRPPMLLLQRVLALGADHASALVELDADAPFALPGQGVPVCVGLEYMGQTAALIAGYQLREGLIGPHLGFLLGSRRYRAHRDFFAPGSRLQVDVREGVVVDDSLANFDCTIRCLASDALLAEATLSVLRRPTPEAAA